MVGNHAPKDNMLADPDVAGPTFRLYSQARDLEHKRTRGRASCAECRRLKIKCDKKIPCASCVRRGCQTVCPNGSLKSGLGSRFILANTDKLHGKLLQMSKRIRQLEDALQIAHANVSSSAHPLLSEELLEIKSTMNFEEDVDNEADGLVSGLSDELGTLSISECGEACFLGRGSAEALLMVMDESLSDQATQDVPTIESQRTSKVLPRQISSMSEVFPFSFDYLPKATLLQMIEERLPSYARATALAEAYLTNIAWSFIVAGREQIFEELLPTVYKRSNGSPATHHDAESEYKSDYVHRLALLLSVLASGAQGDLTLPINNDESKLYNNLARIALSLKSVFVGTSMEAVQTLVMLAAYDFNSCKEHSLGPAWKMFSFGLTLSASIGLHRDPARWKMEPKMVQRRRRLFWEIFCADKWKSLELGRPATFNLREIDCEFPEDKEATVDERGSLAPSFWECKYRFTRDVLAPVAEQLSLARPLRYSEILELDRKLREFEPHPSLSLPRVPDSHEDVTSSLRGFYWAVKREMTLLHIHRSVFARAVLENHMEPPGSPYLSSLLSAYASAVTLLNLLRSSYERHPSMLVRTWIIWAHGLASAVIVGSIACKGNASATAATALKELEATVKLYKAAQVHPVPKKALPFLVRLLERARNANQPVPKGSGISRKELIVLGGVPIFLNKAAQSSKHSTSPASRGTRRLIDGEGSMDVLPICRTPHSSITQQHIPSRLSQQLQTSPTSLDESLSSNLGYTWSQPSTTSSSEISAASDGQTHESSSTAWHENTQDLSPVSWLEKLPHDMLVDLGQNNVSDTNLADLDFLFGGGTNTDISISRGDSIIAEAWHSFLTDI